MFILFDDDKESPVKEVPGSGAGSYKILVIFTSLHLVQNVKRAKKTERSTNICVLTDE